LRKRYYLHAPAHKNYRQILVSSREGANVSEWELLDINKVLTPLVKNGQSVHHAIANNTDRFYVHEKTIYRYIADGLLSVKDGDMPRICKIKPRKSKPVEHKVDTKCRIGRTYDDYNAFIATNPDVRVVQMDSVIGRIGGKVLLTLHWSDMHFMLAFLRERNDSKSVIDIFTKLRETLSLTLFSRLFSVLLTDNGSEFSNPCAIEGGSELNPQIRMFYCDPCASWQKGAAERNHEFIRMILPKATSFDDLSQSHINTVLSHVNSYSRPALNDRTPIDSFMFTFGTELLDKLAIHKIPANQIILKPSLLDS
jgi:IS30 family transposase